MDIVKVLGEHKLNKLKLKKYEYQRSNYEYILNNGLDMLTENEIDIIESLSFRTLNLEAIPCKGQITDKTQNAVLKLEDLIKTKKEDIQENIKIKTKQVNSIIFYLDLKIKYVDEIIIWCLDAEQKYVIE